MENRQCERSIAEVGEREALRLGLEPLRRSVVATVATGDDAAVVPVSDGRFVITTDTMFEGGDFLTRWSAPFDLGWKAIATNAADVAAMGARPLAFTVALGVPAATPISWLIDFARGLQSAIDEMCPDAEVVGGDLASTDLIAIAVTATGQMDGRSPVIRSGAQPGDQLAVAGTLGKAAAGLALLRFDDASLIESYADLVAVQLRPVPPIALGGVAADSGATAMLDVSDGLLLDADRIAESSGVRIKIDTLLLEGYQAVLELAAQSLNARSQTGELDSPADLTAEWVLTGGEDHALLATFPANAGLPRGFKRIGEVLARSKAQTAGVELWRGGNRIDLEQDASGVESFGWDSVRRAAPHSE